MIPLKLLLLIAAIPTLTMDDIKTMSFQLGDKVKFHTKGDEIQIYAPRKKQISHLETLLTEHYKKQGCVVTSDPLTDDTPSDVVFVLRVDDMMLICTKENKRGRYIIDIM